MSALIAADAGLALAALLDDMDFATAAWACREGHRGAAPFIAEELETTGLPADPAAGRALKDAVAAWGAGRDEEALRLALSIEPADDHRSWPAHAAGEAL